MGEFWLAGVSGRMSEGLKLRLGDGLGGEMNPGGTFRLNGISGKG